MRHYGRRATASTVRSMAEVHISIATSATPALVDAFNRLVPQLSSTNPPPSRAEIEEMVASSSSIILVAETDGVSGREIVGTLTLVMFRIPTGIRARIEDVVVDEAARGLGVGERLSRAALDEARRRGARTVDLSSRPSREAANRLYRRMGFQTRETIVYRYDLH